MRQDLAEVISKYQDRGILKVSDFLLTPEDAASFVQDLARIGVLIIGCDLWRPWDKARSNWVELVGAGDVINHRLSSSDARWNAEVIKRFISTEWPSDAERISCILADEHEDDAMLRYLRDSLKHQD